MKLKLNFKHLHELKHKHKLKFNLNQKGIALLTSVFLITLIVWIATEVSYETTVEYGIHARSVQKVQAYYSARSGLELSLLRIKIYKQALKQFSSQLGDQAHLLNMIWSYPFMWPPVLGEQVGAVEKESINDAVKESSLQGSYFTVISDEGSKLDLNDLASPSKKIQEITKLKLTQILEQKFIADPDFAGRNRKYKAPELVDLIQDWVDGDTNSSLGSSEKSFYPNQENTPPNRALRSMGELSLVEGITSEIYEFLLPQTTVYGQKAINPNTAPVSVIKSLHESITDEVAQEIVKRRDNIQEGGPFKNVEDFWSYVNSVGGRVPTENQAQTPLIFDKILTFKITSTGEYRGNTHTIEAVAWDIDEVSNTMAQSVAKELLDKELKKQDPTKGQGSKQTQDKGPPRIIYWHEK